MSSGQPAWRRAFDRVERTVGGPLEGLAGSRRYMDVALLGRKVRSGAGGLVSRPTTAILHLVNIPAREDVRRLSRQIATLTNELRELSAGVEELREPTLSGEKTQSTATPEDATRSSNTRRSSPSSRKPTQQGPKVSSDA